VFTELKYHGRRILDAALGKSSIVKASMALDERHDCACVASQRSSFPSAGTARSSALGRPLRDGTVSTICPSLLSCHPWLGHCRAATRVAISAFVHDAACRNKETPIDRPCEIPCMLVGREMCPLKPTRDRSATIGARGFARHAIGTADDG